MFRKEFIREWLPNWPYSGGVGLLFPEILGTLLIGLPSFSGQLVVSS